MSVILDIKHNSLNYRVIPIHVDSASFKKPSNDLQLN